MNRKLTMRLISEVQEGNIGDDWKYELGAKVFLDGLRSEVSIEVPKHQLEPGVISDPFGSPGPSVLFEGPCEGELLLRLELRATEVDRFISDKGVVSKDVRLEMPSAGSQSSTMDIDLSTGVRESPGILDKNAIFTVRVRLVLENTD